MLKSAKQMTLLAAAVIAIAAALLVILPALATSGDYGVNTGSQLNDSQSPPTATPAPPTPVPPTPVPPTPVPQPTATCAPNTECASPNKGNQ